MSLSYSPAFGSRRGLGADPEFNPYQYSDPIGPTQPTDWWTTAGNVLDSTVDVARSGLVTARDLLGLASQGRDIFTNPFGTPVQSGVVPTPTTFGLQSNTWMYIIGGGAVLYIVYTMSGRRSGGGRRRRRR